MIFEWVWLGRIEKSSIGEINLLSYGYRTNRCAVEPLHIVILVMTRPISLKTRKTIRETWIQAYDKTQVNLTLRFVIGTLSIQTNETESLLTEHEQYGDLLLMNKLKDTYFNLPSKVLMGMRWVSDNLDFDYLVKVDDDMYLRIEVLAQLLREMNCEEMLYWGRFMARKPDRKGPNIEKNWLVCAHYFPYATGGAYVLSEKVVKSAMPSSKKVKLYNNEDVTVGAMLAPFSINRIHDSRFITHGTRCMNDFIVLNVDTDEQLYEIESRLSENEDFCN